MPFLHKVLLTFLVLTPVLAHAGNTGPMQFSVFWPCFGNASFCAPRILAQGVIETDSHTKLVAFLADKESHHTLPPRPDICFDSPGGSLAGALALGRTIRKLRYETCLAPEYSRVIEGTLGNEEVFAPEVVCASACAFALIGGINRHLETGARYGVHQFTGVRANIGDTNTQITVVLLAIYLEEMGVSRNLLDVASLVPPDQLHWLSQDEMQRLRIDNMTVEKREWTLNALDDGTVFTSIVQKKPGSQSQVGLAVVKQSGRPVLVITFVPGEPGFHELQAALEALGTIPIRLVVDGKQIAEYPGGWWTIRKDAVIAGLPLSPQTINALRRGRVLSLEVPVAHVFEQYDPSLEFPLDELARFLSAVLK